MIAAEAGVAQAKAGLAAANKQLACATVRAPFSGVISEKSVSTGDVAQPGSAIYTVIEPSRLELQGTIPADAIGMVHVGLPINFAVTGYQGRAFRGTITRINPTADALTRQIRIYAEIPNAGQTLVGGLYAEGRIASISKQALTLPKAAICRRVRCWRKSTSLRLLSKAKPSFTTSRLARTLR